MTENLSTSVNEAEQDQENLNPSKAKKGPEAYRTISEVAEELHIPQHRLRSWETIYPGVKPFRGESGRRYYNPEHVETLRLISDLLYVQGYKGQGVLRVLRERKARKAAEHPVAVPHPVASAPIEHFPAVDDLPVETTTEDISATPVSSVDDIAFPEAPSDRLHVSDPVVDDVVVLSFHEEKQDLNASEPEMSPEEEKASHVLDECLTGITPPEAEAEAFSIRDTEEMLALQNANQHLCASVKHLDAENEFLRAELREILEELQLLRNLLPV
ncbi:MAG: MerR family transcriptional regulator [Gluconobacter japonicus]|uniref:MerR family transcriptional regulator n=1 Tax=Gluconobacter japonicus TaxID=376620 RepID=UPI0039ED1A28